MSLPQLEIQLIAATAAAACALVGVFLVLRRLSLLSDAIGHSMLLGIVLAFFVTRSLSSPWLIVAAALTGVFTVAAVEFLHRGGQVKEDAAIGLVFPALFSAGVILISRHAGSIHLDTDVVLLGELAFAPFSRFTAFGLDLGPQALIEMGVILLLDLVFVVLFYKELKLATFDPGLAAALGFAPGLVHYGLMTMVSVTAVGAFDAVGSVLVVALMIAPTSAAYLLTDRLSRVLWLSVLLGVASSILGYWVAHVLDASIAGSIAGMAGVLFALVYLVAPERGLISILGRRARQRWDFALTMLAIHLFNHEGLPGAEAEARVDHLEKELRWPPPFARRVVALAERHGVVERFDGSLALTERGRSRARTAIENL